MAGARTRTRPRQPPEETRELILDAAARLLEERAYRELSVEEIMRPTGYGRTVFYRHFSSLPALVGALIERVRPELLATLAEVVAAQSEGTPTEEQTRERYGRFVEFYVRHGRTARALNDAAVMDEELERVLRNASEAVFAGISGALRARGSTSALSAEAAAEAARALTMLHQHYLLGVFGQEPFLATPEAAVEALTFVWRRVLLGGGAGSG